MKIERKAKPYIGLAVGVLAVSFAAILIRLTEAPPLVIGAYRLSLASLILAPIAARQGALHGLVRRDLALCVLSGLFLAMHFASWITSLEYTSVASSVTLVTTVRIWVGLASHFLLGERLSRQMFAGILIAVVGGILISVADSGAMGGALFGNALALLGAWMAAAYFLIGRCVRQRVPILSYIFPTYATAAVGLVLACLVMRQPLVGYDSRTYSMCLLLAVGPQLIGHSSLNWALQYLSSALIAVSVLGEPIGSTVLAAFLLKEIPSPMKLVGGATILAGIYLCARAEAAGIS